MTSDILPDRTPISGPLPQNEAEVKPVVDRAGRQKFVFKNKKVFTALTYGALAVCITVPTTLSVVFYLNVSNVNIRLESLEAAFRSGQLSQLSSSVSSLEKYVSEQDSRFALQDEVSKSLQGLSVQVSSLSDKTGEIAADTAEHRQITLRQEGQLNRLQSNFDVIQGAVQVLNTFKTNLETRATARPAALAVSEEKKHPSQTAKKRIRPARTVPLVAPFILTGIERRGGQVYAVVAPRDAATLSGIQLLAPGGSAFGWTLRSAEGNEALFTVNGIQQRLTAK